MGLPATDDEEFPDEIPLAAHAHVLPEEHIEGRVEIDPQYSALADLGLAMHPTQAGRDAAARTAYRTGLSGVAHGIEEAVHDPGAALSGFAQGALPWIDEIAGYAADSGSSMAPSYEETRDAIRDYDRASEERAPSAHTTGEVLGMLAPAVATGGATAEAEAPSFLRTLLRGIGEGAVQGGAYASGASDQTGTELAEDTAIGALAGGLGGGVVAGVPAGVRSLRATAPGVASRADMARLSSVLGERSAPITSREMQEMTRTLGAGAPRGERVARAAQRVRDAGVVGPFSTVDDILAAVRERLPAAEARTASIRQAFEDSGARVPVQTLPSALERAASEMERDPALAEHAPAVRRHAERSSDVLMRLMDEGGGTSLSDAERALEPLRTRAGYRSLTEVPSTREAWRDALRSGREAIDEQVSQALGSEAARDFVPARRDVQTLRLLEALSEGRAGRAAMRSPLASSLGPILAGILGGGASAGAHGAGVGGGVGLAMAAAPLYRAARTREASMLASGLETLASALGRLPADASAEGADRLSARLSPRVLAELRDRLAARSAEQSQPQGEMEPDFIPDEGPADEAEPDFIPDEAP